MNPDLISLAMVAEDGQELYVEIADYDKRLNSGFVNQVVVPLLEPEKYALPGIQAGAKIGSWLDELEPDLNEHTILIDYMTDWQLLIDVMGLDFPRSVSKVPHYLMTELSTEVVVKATCAGYKEINRLVVNANSHFHNVETNYFVRTRLAQHHALHDARAMTVGWKAALEWTDSVLRSIPTS